MKAIDKEVLDLCRKSLGENMFLCYFLLLKMFMGWCILSSS